jgi:hypothetical protein
MSEALPRNASGKFLRAAVDAARAWFLENLV